MPQVNYPAHDGVRPGAEQGAGLHDRQDVGGDIQDVGGDQEGPGTGHAVRLAKVKRRRAAWAVECSAAMISPGEQAADMAGEQTPGGGGYRRIAHLATPRRGAECTRFQMSWALNDDAVAVISRVRTPSDQRAMPGIRTPYWVSFTSATITPM